MQIVEPKQENSGVPQGNFMKRHRVPKSEDDYFTIRDIDVGCSIELYHPVRYFWGACVRRMQYLGMGAYFMSTGATSQPEISFVVSRAQNHPPTAYRPSTGTKQKGRPCTGRAIGSLNLPRRDLMSRETGKDPTVSHNIQKNPMKVMVVCGQQLVFRIYF